MIIVNVICYTWCAEVWNMYLDVIGGVIHLLV